jgi:hypothetical protein
MKFTELHELSEFADPVESAREACEERAGILEHEAGFDRESAEQAAREHAAKFIHNSNLYALRMQAVRLAEKKRKARR